MTPMVFAGGFTIGSDPKILFLAALIFTLLHIFVTPILRLLLLPITLATFGLLSWFVDVILLYLLMLAIPQIVINPWSFDGFQSGGFIIPAVQLGTIAMVFAVAFFMAVIKAFSAFLVE